eukprot:CAMPEP_0179212760 /NCGR_PEP_ID=MMETSP0797-20121207/1285_1 /TAXON_ID=47934 /ORGANISM="Dinophysis acuminata, Strain DAEP01" /LENGTH=210 /DNA_ID=CAMNT_0020918409 /DNA_START=35 /DNA_END=667 /DNA_ORIENTATION=-
MGAACAARMSPMELNAGKIIYTTLHTIELPDGCCAFKAEDENDLFRIFADPPACIIKMMSGRDALEVFQKFTRDLTTRRNMLSGKEMTCDCVQGPMLLATGLAKERVDQRRERVVMTYSTQFSRKKIDVYIFEEEEGRLEGDELRPSVWIIFVDREENPLFVPQGAVLMEQSLKADSPFPRLFGSRAYDAGSAMKSHDPAVDGNGWHGVH